MKMVLLSIIMTFSMFQSIDAFSSDGGSVRGGGKIVMTLATLNSSWAPKELFVSEQVNGKTQYALTESLRSFIRDEVLSNFDRLGIKGNGNYWNQVLTTQAHYQFVDQLPCEILKNSVSGFDSEKTFGCTQNGVTYLIKDLFFKLNRLNQILAILHERAHTLDVSEQSHDWIQPFVRGVGVLLLLQHEQKEGHFRKIFPEEIRALRDLLTNNQIRKHLGASSYSPEETTISIVENGGGAYFSTPSLKDALVIDETSFIGAGSRINFFEAQCWGWKGQGRLSFSNGTHVLESSLDCVSAKAAQIEKSRVVKMLHEESDYFFTKLFGNDVPKFASRIENSELKQVWVKTLGEIDIVGDSHLIASKIKGLANESRLQIVGSDVKNSSFSFYRSELGQLPRQLIFSRVINDQFFKKKISELHVSF